LFAEQEYSNMDERAQMIGIVKRNSCGVTNEATLS